VSAGRPMRILVLNADYENFLRQHYAANAALRDASYHEQMQSRNESLFAGADFYSRNFRAYGHEAREIHVNNAYMQAAWMRQHGLTFVPPDESAQVETSLRSQIGSLLGPLKPVVRALFPPPAPDFPRQPIADVLRAQIRDFKPDVILNQEMDYIRPFFFRGTLPEGCLLVGQIGSELPREEDFSDYDLVITCVPAFVDWFRARGINAHLNLLAFETSVLDAMGAPPQHDIAVSFVGSLMEVHKQRIALLEQVARAVPLALWGNGVDRLFPESPLHACYRGRADGRKMYDILRRSRISLNQHGFVTGVKDTAANMRLYEATGMASLLLTDAKSNLGTMFDVGRELVTYGSPQECIDKIRYFLAHEDERAEIAAAGQRRTLADHSYFKRTEEILALIAQVRAANPNRSVR
jgi:spore maturation protein CgeB